MTQAESPQNANAREIRVKGAADRQLLRSLLPGAQAVIPGVYSQGLYLEFTDGRLIMLHDESWGSVPFGIAVAGCGALLSRAGVDTDWTAETGRGFISLLPEKGKGIRITLTERKEPAAGGCAPLSRGEFCRIAAEELLASERGALKALALDAAPQTPYSRLAHVLVAGRDIGTALPDLLGLGPGLTPSGDDLAVGWLYMSLRRGRSVEPAERIASAMRGNTCAVSCAFLDAVIKGQSFSLFDDICQAPDEDSLRAAVRSLLLMGANSGADILTGMYLARRQG